MPLHARPPVSHTVPADAPRETEVVVTEISGDDSYLVTKWIIDANPDSVRIKHAVRALSGSERALCGTGRI